MAELIITEKNIEEYKDSLGSSEAIGQVNTIVDDFEQSGSIGDAYDFLGKLQSVLKNLNLATEVKQKYTEFILRLEYTAFPLLENEEQSEVLSKYLLFAINKEIDIKDRIHFVFFPYFLGTQKKDNIVSVHANT